MHQNAASSIHDPGLVSTGSVGFPATAQNVASSSPSGLGSSNGAGGLLPQAQSTAAAADLGAGVEMDGLSSSLSGAKGDGALPARDASAGTATTDKHPHQLNGPSMRGQPDQAGPSSFAQSSPNQCSSPGGLYRPATTAWPSEDAMPASQLPAQASGGLGELYSPKSMGQVEGGGTVGCQKPAQASRSTGRRGRRAAAQAQRLKHEAEGAALQGIAQHTLPANDVPRQGDDCALHLDCLPTCFGCCEHMQGCSFGRMPCCSCNF